MITERALVRLVRAYAKLAAIKRTSYAEPVKVLLRAYGAGLEKRGVASKAVQASVRQLEKQVSREYGAVDREFSVTNDELERWAVEGYPPNMPTV